MVMVADSWSGCHKFESSATDNPLCRRTDESQICPGFFHVTLGKWNDSLGIVLTAGPWLKTTMSVTNRRLVVF
ncbi:hypothetical protein TNCV_3041391 [Trichonephila clavipes]|nr:hypothetical protein TNCV_3041391 [Trichonephila clavipes]